MANRPIGKNWPRIHSLFDNISMPSDTVILKAEQWNEYIGTVWCGIFQMIGLSKNAIVVEVGPGRLPKIAIGLARYHFQGTIYIVEAQPAICANTAKLYKQMLPQAKVMPLACDLNLARSLLPKKISAVFSNHPLDDMLLFEGLGAARGQQFFQGLSFCQPSDIQSVWQEIESRHQVQFLKQRVIDSWNELIRSCKPSWVGISQYPTLAQKQMGFDELDQCAHSVLQDLRRLYQNHCASYLNPVIEAFRQNPNDWLIFAPQSKFIEDLNASPQVRARLGDQSLVSFTGWRLPQDKTKLIYVNKEVARKYGYEELTRDFRSAELLLTNALNIDTDLRWSALGTGEVELYADYQNDPSGIGMNGNLGSGRAAYFGKHFNRKGLGRTPLAVQPREDLHGTGRCPLVGAIWELLVSNIVSSNLSTGGPLILNAFLLDIYFPKPGGKKGELSRAVALDRIDDGTLDRPTHLFNGKSKSGRVDIMALAKKFARQEAEKFIERILQGAWSAGNISLHGHTLDLEASCTVYGHYPQYTLQSWFEDNYFGLEWKGQLKVLKMIIEESVGAESHSVSQINFIELEKQFLIEKESWIERRMLDLLGVKKKFHDRLLQTHRDKIAFLSQQFQELSSIVRPDFRGFDSRDRKSASIQIFDFSNLFRRFTLGFELYKSMEDRIRFGVDLLIIPIEANARAFEFIQNENMNPSLEEKFLGRYCVRSKAEYESQVVKAKVFISECYLFLWELFRNQESDWRKSFVINEDRHYLTASYGRNFLDGLCSELNQNMIQIKLFRKYIELLHRACDRRTRVDRHGRILSDMRLFKEGAIWRLLNRKGGYHIVINLFNSMVDQSALDGSWRVKIDNKYYDFQEMSRTRHELKLISEVVNDLGFAKVSQFIRLELNGKWIIFTDYAQFPPKCPHGIIIE